MSDQLNKLREHLDSAWNDSSNKDYYIRKAKDELAPLDEYVSMLENSVAVMSATLNKRK